MKIIGEKLRKARIIRGYSITELAKECGISKQAISQYENEDCEPKDDVLLTLSSILRFPIRFFTCAVNEQLEVRNTFFRSKMSANNLDKTSWAERAKIVSNFYLLLNEYLELPNYNLPEISQTLIENKDYETISKKVRNYWGIKENPIPNMVNLLEENGIVVSTMKNYADNLSIDAFTQTYRKSNVYCIILEDIKNSMARRNFSLAHELGHIILHKDVNFDEMTNEEKREKENEADKFASCFLLPCESFQNDLRNINPCKIKDYIPLKEKWCVSIGAMILRAREICNINNVWFQRLIKAYSYYHYRTNEPLDDQLPMKKPSLFTQALEILLENKIFTPNTLIDKFEEKGYPLYLKDFTDFFSLDQNFFDKYENNAQVIKLKKIL